MHKELRDFVHDNYFVLRDQHFKTRMGTHARDL